MGRQERQAARFPAGLVLFTLAICLHKSVQLSLQTSGEAWQAWRFALLDGLFLAILAMLALGAARIRRRGAWILACFALWLLTAFYAVHSQVLLELDESMSVTDLGRYLPEWQVVSSFLGVSSLLIGLVLVGSALFRLRLRHAGAWLLACIALAAAGGAWSLNAPFALQKYGLVPLAQLGEQWRNRRPVSTYSESDVAYYREFAAAPAQLPVGRPDIILLVVESLSSINSLRSAGVRDALPEFDRVAEKGVLFTRFLANHAASEGGLISLMSGFPPLHYPTASPLMFDEFAMQVPVVREYRQAGYFVEFLTNTDRSFIGMDRYLDGIAVDLARGRDEVPAFAGAPRFVQDAPSDRYLYAEALARVEARRDDPQPWLLVLATVSTHLPYTHPEGGEDSAEAVWHWSMARLAEFVAALEQGGYFEHSVLLITGDHRQMRPLTEEETGRFGDSARARVPLLAIGPSFTPGTVDHRLFQQSDLLRFLGRLADSAAPLSPYAVWVERYNRIYGRVESINRFRVFEESGEQIVAFEARMLGTDLQWPGRRPPDFRAIESRIHAQRSLHQFQRSGAGGACRAGQSGAGQPVLSRVGMSLSVYPGAKLDVVPPPADSRVVGAFQDIDAPAGELVRLLTWLEVTHPGTYWFRFPPGQSACLSLDGSLLIDQSGAVPTQAPVTLQPGSYLLDMRIISPGEGLVEAPQWVQPGLQRWNWQALPPGRLPATEAGRTVN